MSFSKDISNFTTKVLVNANIAARNIIGEIEDELIFRTPVDTGRARANWLLGIDNVPTKVFMNSFDPDGSGTSGKLHSLIPENVLGHSIYIANNVPYILSLENGKSSQAPNGMVKMTQFRFKTFIKRSMDVNR